MESQIDTEKARRYTKSRDRRMYFKLRYGGTGMKKRSTVRKKIMVLFLSAMLISAMMPGQARAQNDTEAGVHNEDDTDLVPAATDDTIDSENTVQTMAVQDAGAEEKTEDLNVDNPDADDGKEQEGTGDKDKTDQLDDQQKDSQHDEEIKEDEGQPGYGAGDTVPGEIPELPDAVAVSMLMDSTNDLYADLSQFLSLSSDQFQVYTVAVIDPATKQPVQPESPVEVSLDVPSGYDTDRVVVSEISMNGETPARTELSFSYNNGKAEFETDHSGIYVVMEKKEQPKLPASLEMTSKTEKLELTKKYPDSVSPSTSEGTLTVNPQTGDDNSVLIWGVVTVIAAAAVVALVVIIIKRRK